MPRPRRTQISLEDTPYYHCWRIWTPSFKKDNKEDNKDTHRQKKTTKETTKETTKTPIIS
ncbi:hypothetical protein NDN17_15910 [Shewanella algae]|uniref:hypothetical protein n=1 Tax=Shewanella algae TaxID=38313 RepID=UPI0020351607|nr:hypothetical protein [Shewanella algae]MCM2529986.1 hypothetical protein [Shewanella algae]